MADEQAAPEPVMIEGTGIELDSTVDDLAAAMLPQEEGEEQQEVVEAKPEQVEAKPEVASAEKPAATVDTLQSSNVDTPPDSWRAEAKAAWATTPPAVREEMRKRENDFKSYYESVKQPVEVGKKLTDMISPYLPMLNETGTDPWSNMEAMFKIQEKLVRGTPEEKLAIVQGFASSAGIKFENGQLSAAPDSTNTYIKQLEARLGQLEGGVKQVTSVVQEARLAELQGNIRKFAEDTEAHPHFADVTDQMTQLIKAGAAASLEDAYNTACASNPVIRQKLIDAAVAQAAAKRETAAKEQVAKARGVAKARVRSTATTGTPQPLGDIDSTLKDTLAEIHSRH